jgi:hypothetical protein
VPAVPALPEAAMILDVGQLVLLGILSGTIHWLVARSGIARPFWSRATGWANNLLRCAGCCGWWIGLGLGSWGLTPLRTGSWIGDVIAAGILSTFVTPLGETILLWGRDGSAIQNSSTPGSESGSESDSTAGSDLSPR